MKHRWPLKSKIVGVIGLALILLVIPSTTGNAISQTRHDNTWTPVASMSTPRAGLAAAVVGGTIYAIGGCNETHWFSTVEEYDPTAGTWSSQSPMPTARSYFVAVAVNDKIYAIGGRNKDGPLATIEVYDPDTDSWERRKPMEQERQDFVAVAVKGQIYIIGGKNKEGVLSSVHLYDPMVESEQSRSAIPTPRFGMAAAVVNNIIYVLGGNDGENQLAITEAYDPDTDTWITNRTPMYDTIEGFAGVTIGGRLYTLGGRRDLPIIEYKKLYTGEYDPRTDSWQKRTALPKDATTEHVAAVAIAGRIYVLGGRYTAEVWRYDPPFYDTDGDGLADDEELAYFDTNPFVADANIDGDRLPNFWEEKWGTNPKSNDTDEDGLTDGEEVINYLTNPTLNDTDKEGLIDGDEVNQYGTDPLNPDTDGDKFDDYEEINITLTDPLVYDIFPEMDIDGDGLSNKEEWEVYGTNPSLNDTDGDGLNDGDEIWRYSTNATLPDVDADTDADGLSNVVEVDIYNTNPFRIDTDGDGLEDGAEIARGTDPNLQDSDNDFWGDKTDPLPLINNFLFIIPSLGLGMALGIHQIQRKRKRSALLEYLERDLALTLFRISEMYRKKSELEKAVEYAQQSLTIREEQGDHIGVAWILEELGEIYRKKGDVDQALEYNQRCLSIREQLGDHNLIARSLYLLVNAAIAHNSLDLARYYLHELQQISGEEINLLITQQTQVAEALVLKISLNSRNQAEEIFKQIITNEVIDPELAVVVFLNLCEILLRKMRVSKNPGILREIQSYVDQIQVIATQQDSYYLLAEIYVLQSKLALLNLNLEDARYFLTQVKQLVEAHEFHQLTPQIISEYDTLFEQLSHWDALIGYDLSLGERLKLTAPEKQVSHILLNFEREMPSNLLTIKKTSTPLEKTKTTTPVQARPPSMLEIILRKHPPLKYDDISKAIISCLERKNGLNIYQLTEEVRKQRGRASRQVIRERVERLINQGFLEELEEGHGRQVRIVPHLDR